MGLKEKKCKSRKLVENKRTTEGLRKKVMVFLVAQQTGKGFSMQNSGLNNFAI